MSQRVATLANNGYTTVFLFGQEGVNVFHANGVDISLTAPPALQRWRDDRELLSMTGETTISQNIDVAKIAMISKITYQSISSHFSALENNRSHLPKLAHTRQ